LSARDLNIKMKELEARSGVGREAIRFYIREGMLPEPERPKRNVAFYTEEHIRRLQTIRKLREERFLPLSVIKSLINSDEFDALAAREALPGLEHVLPALVYGVAAADSELGDVAATHGFTARELEALHEIGAIEIRDSGGRKWLDSRDVAIVKIYGEMRGAGFTPERGYQVESLERYVDFAEWLARDEVKRFFQSFADLSDARSASELGARGIVLANELITRLHTRAIVRMVTRLQPAETH
jgi:DNA-binding transcriptional MerR regulator